MNFVTFSDNLTHISVVHFPAERRRFSVSGMSILHQQALPTDAIGYAIVTFSGVHADSEIRVYLPDRTEAAGIESCVDDQQLSWEVYPPGSPNNTVVIRIINALYKIKEFSYTASVGLVSIPIQQEVDKWFKNPV